MKSTVDIYAACNHAQLYEWEWREWDAFFVSSFKPFPGIQRIQHFRFSQSHPSIVFTCTACDSPEDEFNLLKRGVQADSFSAENLPSVLMPAGLSMDRARYLHKEIVPFV